MATLTPQAISFLSGTVNANVPRQPISSGPYATGANLYSLLQTAAFYGSNGTNAGRIPVLEQQVNSYYATAQLYQQNITNLTSALTDINGGDYVGTSNPFNWYTGFITPPLPASGTLPPGVNQTFQTAFWSNTNVATMLSSLFGATLNTSGNTTIELQVNGQTVNALISTQQNYLSNEQTFLNSAVNSIQSEISLVGQILNSITQTISEVISNTR